MVSRVPLHNSKAIGWLLNVSIAVMLLVFSGILIKRYYWDSPDSPTIGPSAKIYIKGVDFSKSPQTLLLAITKDCDYCTDSAPFYRRLVQGLLGRSDIRVVALFPVSHSNGDYLNTLGISVDEAAEASLPSLGIKNVPTLALLNHDGVVSDVWIGKLPPMKEAEVMKRLGIEDNRPSSDWIISENELRRRLDNQEEIVVVDLRERAQYAQGHFPGARNIPADELRTRAVNEVPRSATIVLYGSDDIVTESSYMTLSAESFQQVLILSQKPIDP